MSVYFRPSDGVTATRTTFEGVPAALLAGHPDTLAEFIDALSPELDTDHTKGFDRPRICTVWPAWSTMGFEGLLDELRRTSDAARIDLTISVSGAPRDTLPAPCEVSS